MTEEGGGLAFLAYMARQARRLDFSVLWAAVMMIVVVAAATALAIYLSRSVLAGTGDARPWRAVQLARRVKTALGIAALILGVVAFVLDGHNWLVLALFWAFGLLRFGLQGRIRYLAQYRHRAGRSR